MSVSEQPTGGHETLAGDGAGRGEDLRRDVLDDGRTPLEPDAAVNPYSLLEAVNDSSDAANTAWLIFLGLMAYLTVAVAGVSHKDLLLNKDISLPILQVGIELTRFFLFAPIVVVLFHLGVVMQLVMLARKAIEFDQAVRLLEPGPRRTHPLRLELHNFFFVQAIAGPERSRVMSMFLHSMSWLTLAVLPVMLLLYIQVVFLPYHDITTTWAHRSALVCDIILLTLIGVFLVRSEPSFFRAFGQMSRTHPLGSTVTTCLLAVISFFSFFVATIPGEKLDRLGRALAGQAAEKQVANADYFVGFMLPFFGASSDGTLFGIFRRNLVVTDTVLVVDKDLKPGERSLNLRERDLRYARLDRSLLPQADFAGARLDGASFQRADLRGARFTCGATTGPGQESKCVTARGAQFDLARLGGATFGSADLAGAQFKGADLQETDLAFATLTLADFGCFNDAVTFQSICSNLDRVVMSSALLIGAKFTNARMHGADLSGAILIAANLQNAHLQAAILRYARLQGASLDFVELDGAELVQARLEGVDLAKVRSFRGADLREAQVWSTTPVGIDQRMLVDLADIVVRQPDAAEIEAINQALARIEDAERRSDLKLGLVGLLNPTEAGKWGASAEAGRWKSLVAASSGLPADVFRKDLTDYLIALACRPAWSGGGVATGVAKRAIAENFKGDPGLVLERLKRDECPASRRLAQSVLDDLGLRVEAVKAP